MNGCLKSILLVAFLFSLFNPVPAQEKENDTLLLMSGKEITGKILDQDEYELRIRAKKRKKLKEYMIEKYRVFSIKKNGKETILYEQDSAVGDYYSQQQMRYYIFGEQDANEGFKTPFTNVAGFAFGAAGGYLLSEGNFIGIGPPVIFIAGSAIPGAHVRKKTVSNMAYLKHEPYHSGYSRVAKGKRVQNAIKSSIVGTLAGLLVFSLIGNN